MDRMGHPFTPVKTNMTMENPLFEVEDVFSIENVDFSTMSCLFSGVYSILNVFVQNQRQKLLSKIHSGFKANLLDLVGSLFSKISVLVGFVPPQISLKNHTPGSSASL